MKFRLTLRQTYWLAIILFVAGGFTAAGGRRLLGVLVMIAALVVIGAWWRCPHCGKTLGRGFKPRCEQCGGEIEYDKK